MIHYFTYRDEQLLVHHTLSERPSENRMLPLMHAHEHYEILYCISGDCEFIAEGCSYALTPGAALITRPAEVHHVRVVRDVPYERIVINFSDKMVESIDPERRLLKPFNERAQGSLNRYEGQRLQAALENNIAPLRNDARPPIGQTRFDYDTSLELKIGVYAALRELQREFEGAHSAPNTAPRVGNAVLDFINEHLYESDLTTEMVASRFFISRSQLNRSFNSLTGATVREYIVAKRLIYAKQLIDAGGSAAAACEAACFADYSTFYRAYRKKFAAAPTQRRNEGLGEN